MTSTITWCVTTMGVIACAGTIAAAAEFHVAPNGAANGSGTAEAPFATVAQARDFIREQKRSGGLPGGGVTVWIHGGDYFVDDSITFGPEDSGSEGSVISYRGVAGENPRLIGGHILPAGAFSAVTGAAVLARMDDAARTHVRQIDLGLHGASSIEPLPDGFEAPPIVPELFINDQRLNVARWPNEGWAEIAQVIESGPAPWRNHESSAVGTFEYAEDRPSRWLAAPELWVHGYWCFDWSAESIKVKSIDVANKQITFAKSHHYGIGSGNEGPRRYYAFNLLEELDAPGEYYIDRIKNVLYVWPTVPLDGARVVVSTLKSPVIEARDVSHMTIAGLTVETTAGTGIAVNGGNSVHIRSCRVRNTGQGGIQIRDGHSHGVASCDIFDTGTEGVHVNGGNRKNLEPSQHEIVNNHIHRVSRRQQTHAYNIHVGGVGVRVAHNELNDAPHQAIGLGGNDHLIEYNEIHHIALEVDDSGAFYMGRNPSERGNVIQYNYWHDIGSARALGTCAVYFDDGTGGQRVFGNVFYKCAGGNFGAVFVHGGHDNVVENNLFIECKKAIGHAPWNDDTWNKWLTEPLWQTRLLEEVDITKPPYTERYSGLDNFMSTEAKIRVNHAARNVVIKCDNVATGNWNAGDLLVLNYDPGFVNLAGGDFSLRDDSIVYKLYPEFRPIPFHQIGTVEDDARNAIPR